MYPGATLTVRPVKSVGDDPHQAGLVVEPINLVGQYRGRAEVLEYLESVETLNRLGQRKPQ